MSYGYAMIKIMSYLSVLEHVIIGYRRHVAYHNLFIWRHRGDRGQRLQAVGRSARRHGLRARELREPGFRRSSAQFRRGFVVSANLRDSPRNFHQNCAGKCQSPGSRNPLVLQVAS